MLQARATSSNSGRAAHFTDGHVEDVTRWAKYTSTNESVAQIDDAGQVHGIRLRRRGDHGLVRQPRGRGIGHVAVRKAGRRRGVCHRPPGAISSTSWSLAKLASLNIPPSPPADDDEFIRRAYLDTIGVLPTADETRAFLAERRPTSATG